MIKKTIIVLLILSVSAVTLFSASSFDEQIAVSVSYINNNEHDKALDSLNKAISIDPAKALSYKLIAMIYEAKRDNKRAIEYWNKYLRHSNSSTDGTFILEAQKHLERLEEEIQ
ncbi:MAG: hypothetical protein ABH857_01610 [Elusimicrobiota bacterium]